MSQREVIGPVSESEYLYLQKKAQAKARNVHGLVPDGTSCVDCGRAATAWDHRDYREPLKVEPVCRKCNGKRGRALPAFEPSRDWCGSNKSEGGEGYEGPAELPLAIDYDLRDAQVCGHVEDHEYASFQKLMNEGGYKASPLTQTGVRRVRIDGYSVVMRMKWGGLYELEQVRKGSNFGSMP